MEVTDDYIIVRESKTVRHYNRKYYAILNGNLVRLDSCGNIVILRSLC